MNAISLSCVCILGLSSLLFAALEEKAAYDPIINCKPFGDAVPKVDSKLSPDAQKQREEIAQKFRMCGITEMPDGERKIAFLDETTGTVQSYLLGEGETQNGFHLISVDYDREMATLTKDELTFTLGLGRGMLDDAEVTAAQAEPAAEEKVEAPSPRSRRGLPGASRGDKGTAKGSFKARLMQRRANEAAAKEASAGTAEAELAAKTAQAARRIQIDRIKQGLEPTEPITLTAEEDAELEAAGAFRKQAPADPAPPQEP